MKKSRKPPPEQGELFGGSPPAPPPTPEPAPGAADDRPEPAGGAKASGSRDPLQRLFDDNFLQYAAYVIRDRAIPELDDGLKPVQRRILFALHEKDDGKLIKVANIVGYTMQFHPHGDASIGEALVSLANRGYLIERQGNFGNLFTGDPAAAARYIECRLTPLAREELFNNFLTRMAPTYDSRRKEPVVLPCKLPLLLMLGVEGIAVGLATRILPHNFPELLRAQIAVLQKKPFSILPDFPQGGLMDASEYDDGRGRVRVRAAFEPRGERVLVIREIPPGTTTDSVMSSIEEAARKKRLKVRAIRDFTAEKVEIEIELAAGQDRDRALQALYAFTQCEVSLNSSLVVIHQRRPVEKTVSEIVYHLTERLMTLLRRELKLRRKNLLDGIHRQTLVQLFVEERLYKRIEECATFEAVHDAVFEGVNRFRERLRRPLSPADIEMLLGIRIRRISRFDIERNRKEIDGMVKELAEVEKHLKRLVPYTVSYLRGLLKNHEADWPRRTRIQSFGTVEVRELTRRNLSLRRDLEKGYLGIDIEGEEAFGCTQFDRLALVWNDGRYKVIPPPEKLFVGQDLAYAAVFDRDRVMTLVYRHEDVTYLKRFTFGGAILNKEYNCAAEGAEVLFLTDDQPEELYVKYRRAKRQRIHQQVFRTEGLAVKGVKARGAQMTVKPIRSITTTKPRNWDRDDSGPRGALLEV